LRQAPDCILIGEIRDRETMTAAISYALSGHLVLATLHANNSYHALGRILSFYNPEARPTLLADLASGLKAIVSQRLMRANSGGRMPAVEVLLNTKLVSDLIEKGDLSGVKEAVEKSTAEGSQTFEADIARLINEGLISRDEGLAQSDSPTNLLWRLQNDQAPVSRAAPRRDEPEQATFTDITIDVRPEESRLATPTPPPWPARR
ncbi:MAG: ATPase, T2SS/T4P/T4SS family, partial [Rubrivivax sp.]